MKKAHILGVSVLGILLPLFSTAQNNVGIGLYTGLDYSPRDKTDELHFGAEYDKQFANGNGVLVFSMSGKREVLRQETDTSASKRKFFVLEGMTGLSINEERSKIFAGPVILVGGGVCWDNWKLEDGFPVFFSTALQININMPNDIAAGDENFGLGFFARCVYENFYYKIEDEPNKEKRSRVNPMIAFEGGLRLTLRGAK